jgi:predicted regulator of Ras-like GTPase activity (Roadblock/LC7/MglB family)
MIFEEVVVKVVEEVHGSMASVIMGRDGIALSQHLAEGVTIDLETLGVEYSNLLAEVTRASQAIGSGDVHEVCLLTDQYMIVIRAINPEYFIALIMSPRGNLGKGRFLLRTSAPKIAAEL